MSVSTLTPLIPSLSPVSGDLPRVCKAWCQKAAGEKLEYCDIELPPIQDDEVEVRIIASGICYSDVDALSGRYGPMVKYPLVAGHEGAGVITHVGSLVKHVKIGSRVGVGVYRDSCGCCVNCSNSLTNLCPKKALMFMLGKTGTFAEYVRIKGAFALPLPDSIPFEYAAPLLCAGVTTFAPFRVWDVKSGQSVGVVGVGGLGHLSLQFASKSGCATWAFSSSANKEQDCRALGASRFVDLSDPESKKQAIGQIDYLMITASGPNVDYAELLSFVAPNGKMILMGVTGVEVKLPLLSMIQDQKSVAGSAAGSTGNALEMLRFVDVTKIKPMIQTFQFDQINSALDVVGAGTVRFRAVLVNHTSS